MNYPKATQQALSILYSGDLFQWYVIRQRIADIHLVSSLCM